MFIRLNVVAKTCSYAENNVLGVTLTSLRSRRNGCSCFLFNFKTIFWRKIQTGIFITRRKSFIVLVYCWVFKPVSRWHISDLWLWERETGAHKMTEKSLWFEIVLPSKRVARVKGNRYKRFSRERTITRVYGKTRLYDGNTRRGEQVHYRQG